MDEGPVAGAQVRDPQAGVRVVPALGGAGRRLEVEVVRHPQHQAVGRDRNQLGVRARSAVDEARDALALVPPVDVLAEGLDHPEYSDPSTVTPGRGHPQTSRLIHGRPER